MRLAGVYTRISSDDGRAFGVQRQKRDCEALVRRLGWKVVEVYTDNDVSAFTSRQRPAYVRMLRDLEAGRLDAVVCWDVDRLTRSPLELEDIIDLAEKRGVALASVGGDIDLATPQGRLTARIKASVARHEVEQSSRRIRRKALERAEAGRPHGRVAYGWSRVDARDIIREDQATVIREAATRLIAGESLRSITRDLNARAVPSPNGLAWQSPMLKQVLLRERNVALRRHQGQIIGKAAWDPILDEGTFARLRTIFEDPRRRRKVTGAAKHLLSGIALCGKCHTPLRVIVAHGSLPSAYTCPACFGVRRKQVSVDAAVTALVVARLAQPDILEVFTPHDGDARAQDLAVLRARLDEAADRYAQGLITGEQLSRISARLRPAINALEEEQRRALPIPDLAELTHGDIQTRWNSLPLERKRAVIDVLMQIRILPAAKVGRVALDPQCLEVTWRTALREGEAVHR